MDVEREMERFLRRGIFARGEEGDESAEPIRKAVLRHSAPGTKGNDVETFEVKEKFSTDDLESLVDDILKRAQADADGIGGVQHYALHLYAKGKDRSVARFPFRMRGQDDDYDTGAGDEPANMKGVLTQFMRHNEAYAKTMTQGFGSVTAMLVRRLEDADKQIGKLLAQRGEDMALMESLRSEQNDRDIKMLEAESSERRKDAIFEKVALIVPVMLNKLMKQKVIPSEDPSMLMLQQFVESISSDQLAKLSSSLNPEQLIVLYSLLQGFKEKEEAKKKQLTDGAKNGS